MSSLIAKLAVCGPGRSERFLDVVCACVCVCQCVCNECVSVPMSVSVCDYVISKCCK